jgi:hypothetical protein
MADRHGTLCRQRMIVMTFVGMNVTPNNLSYNTFFRSAKSYEVLLSMSLLWATKYRTGHPPPCKYVRIQEDGERRKVCTDENITKYGLEDFPLAEYPAEHWAKHMLPSLSER